MLISVECELPAVMADTGAPTRPEVFMEIWKTLSGCGWDLNPFAISRKVADPPTGCMNAEQVITTDTGPTIELAPCPRETVKDIEKQVDSLRDIIANQLATYGVRLLGSGIHPILKATEEDYYAFRTRRKAYDYALKQRGWSHHSILNICATQEIIDVEISHAIRVLRVVHRLAGLSLLLFRNDPDLYGDYPHSPYSIRPAAWKMHVPRTGRFAKDTVKVWLPPKEILSWEQYLALLWDANPMFLLGTKNNGLIYIPEHPTFWEYLMHTPKGGWPAKTVKEDAETCIYPEFTDILQTDWTYMGFARLRWKWKNPLPTINSLIDARVKGEIDDFLAEHVGKVVLEHRANATAMPGQEMTSLAFVLGLVSNLEATEQFVSRYPYKFWIRLAQKAESQPLSGSINGKRFTMLLQDVLKISRDGLLLRGYGEDEYLVPLFERVENQISPSEIMLEVFRKKGVQGILDLLGYPG